MLFTLMIIVITREKAIPDVKGSNYDFYQDFYNFFPHPIDIRTVAIIMPLCQNRRIPSEFRCFVACLKPVADAMFFSPQAQMPLPAAHGMQCLAMPFQSTLHHASLQHARHALPR